MQRFPHKSCGANLIWEETVWGEIKLKLADGSQFVITAASHTRPSTTFFHISKVKFRWVSIKCFHDDSPVLLTVVEPFAWRPPEILFRNMKNHCNWGASVIDNRWKAGYTRASFPCYWSVIHDFHRQVFFKEFCLNRFHILVWANEQVCFAKLSLSPATQVHSG